MQKNVIYSLSVIKKTSVGNCLNIFQNLHKYIPEAQIKRHFN